MNGGNLETVIADLVSAYGVDAVVEAANVASARLKDHPSVCTIIVNSGIHNFPNDVLFGEIYTFSEGSMDFSDPDSVREMISAWLDSLVEFLKSQKWKSINIVISGHPVLNMLVKAMAYRVTRIDTIDWVYNNEGGYFPIQIKLRDVAAAKSRA